jgi:hypothetical protein
MPVDLDDAVSLTTAEHRHLWKAGGFIGLAGTHLGLQRRVAKSVADDRQLRRAKDFRCQRYLGTVSPSENLPVAWKMTWRATWTAWSAKRS